MHRMARLLFFVLPLEFFYPSGCVHEDFFACVEGVGGGADLYFDQGVFFAIFPLDAVFRVGGRAGQQLKVARSVQEDHFSVGWVDSFFHK